MKPLFFLAVLVCLAGTGCKLFVKTIYGAKQPRPETQASIQNWLSKHNFGKNEATTLSPEAFYDFTFFYRGAPLLFDRLTGRFMPLGFTNGAFCPKDVDQRIASILPYRTLGTKPDNFIVHKNIFVPPGTSIRAAKKMEGDADTAFLNLFDLCRDFYNADGSAFSLGMGSEDYVLILPFAIYLGNRVQLINLNKYYDAARQNKMSRIRVLFLNLDKQEWWGPEWNGKIRLNI
jgi:hypothetical protein